jgi:hypothetical protein|tara:strand:- start:473 stop:601 length:129 start_codon:yes stop_codon:yes gene_type:complete
MHIAQVAALLLSILVLQAQADDLVLVDDGRAACGEPLEVEAP